MGVKQRDGTSLQPAHPCAGYSGVGLVARRPGMHSLRGCSMGEGEEAVHIPHLLLHCTARCIASAAA